MQSVKFRFQEVFCSRERLSRTFGGQNIPSWTAATLQTAVYAAEATPAVMTQSSKSSPSTAAMLENVMFVFVYVLLQGRFPVLISGGRVQLRRRQAAD